MLAPPMAPTFPKLADCRAGLAQSWVPVWVSDMETLRCVWANARALEFLQAESAEELYARDNLDGISHSALAMIRSGCERVRKGEVFHNEWTFYPKGEPVTAQVELRGIDIGDGRLGLLTQSQRRSEASAVTLQRSMAIAQYTSTLGVLLNTEGEDLATNFAGEQTMGKQLRWREWFCDPEVPARILSEARAGERVRELAEVEVQGERRWFLVEAQTLRDPATGALGILVEHRDDTERVEAQALADSRGADIDRLSETLRLVETQRAEILSLTAPLLEVGAGTLAVPLTGELGADKLEATTIKLLDAVRDKGVRTVILDLTGVLGLESGNVSRLLRLIRALRLLGTRPVITGIRAELAAALSSEAEALEALDGIPTLRSLAAGLGFQREH